MDPGSRRLGGRPFPLSASIPPLHWVTDDRVVDGPDFVDRAAAAARSGGARIAIHLRAHAHGGAALDRLARALRASCASSGAALWVNDRVDVALAARADGVQVGRRGLPVERVRALAGTAPVIGVSVHSRAEAEAAAAAGADAVMLGPVFETASHPEAEPLGLDALRETCRLPLPVLAIGGITPARVEAVRACGAAGVAVLRGGWTGPGEATGERVAAYLAAWTSA